MSITTILFKIIFYLLAFVLIVFMAYYSTRFIAKKSSSIVKTRNVNIIDSISLGNNNRIIIIEVFKYIYILSINNNQTIVIDKILQSEVDVSYQNEGVVEHGFAEYLDSFLKSIKKGEKEEERVIDRTKEIHGLNNRLLELKHKISDLAKRSTYDIHNNEDENDEKM